MRMFSQFINDIFSSVSKIPFDTLVWIIIGSYLGITALTLILTLAIPRLRRADKRPYLCLVNAYSALVLCAFLTREQLAQSALAAALFWFFGYLAYGLISVIPKKSAPAESAPAQISLLPARQSAAAPRAEVPVAKSSVRLEHAISVTERLLTKNLGKSDRQELEKLKNILAVLQTKGELTPSESEILNENFNALLKLMAKYNI